MNYPELSIHVNCTEGHCTKVIPEPSWVRIGEPPASPTWVKTIMGWFFVMFENIIILYNIQLQTVCILKNTRVKSIESLSRSTSYRAAASPRRPQKDGEVVQKGWGWSATHIKWSLGMPCKLKWGLGEKLCTPQKSLQRSRSTAGPVMRKKLFDVQERVQSSYKYHEVKCPVCLAIGCITRHTDIVQHMDP